MQLRIENLSRNYNDKRILSGFSYVFHPGVTCIFGPSGCGKTTLIRLIAGLEKADSGTIIFPDNEKISLVFQEDRLFENLSAVHNLSLAAPKGTHTQSIIALLASLGIQEPWKKINAFSGGMKRRTSVARALIAPHNILLLDEPCTGLDIVSRQLVINAIKDDAASGIIIICVTHNMSDISDLNATVLRFPSADER